MTTITNTTAAEDHIRMIAVVTLARTATFDAMPIDLIIKFARIMARVAVTQGHTPCTESDLIQKIISMSTKIPTEPMRKIAPLLYRSMVAAGICHCHTTH